MKRICALVVLTLSLTACKKESPVNDSTLAQEQVVDSAALNQQPISTLKEITPEALSQTLNAENDTLYVTNFFATWCGPCIREMPHFKEKMTALQDEKVKFTFVSLDEKEDWSTKVVAFGKEYGISQNVVLLDGQALEPSFYSSNFKTWDGSSIPFTQFRKGAKTLEIVGMMTQETMNSQFEAIQAK